MSSHQKVERRLVIRLWTSERIGALDCQVVAAWHLVFQRCVLDGIPADLPASPPFFSPFAFQSASRNVLTLEKYLRSFVSTKCLVLPIFDLARIGLLKAKLGLFYKSTA